MKLQSGYQHNPLTLSGLLPGRNWKTALWHMLLLFVVVLCTEIPTAQADGLFDFQMKLAKKGNAEAQFKIGEMYESGFGVEKDMEQARIWINKAAAKGHKVAGYKLLYWDLKKNGVTSANRQKLNTLRQAADNEEPNAVYYLGKMHAYGVGMKKQPQQGLELLNKAAFLGVLEAERDAVSVREAIQRAQLAKRRAEQKRQAMLKKKQEEERRKKLEAQRKAEEARRLAAQKEAERKRKEAEKLAAQKRAAETADKQKEAERLKAERERAAREAAEREALEREREARRKALLTERKKREEKRRQQFESDPCAGKSARFLSTCR